MIDEMGELMTISALEARTGVPRTSIHFYLREGLLPQPQKSASNRSVYTEDHAALLRRIKESQEAGKSLADIRAEIRHELSRIEERDVDLIQRENDRMRRAIVRAATEQFLEHGYEQTRVADIVRNAGVSSQVFYSLFPGKGELLVECFRTFVSWNLAFVEPKLETADPGERLLWRMLADARANEFGSSVMSLLRSEAPNGKASDLTRLVEQAWGPIIHRIVLELESFLKPGVKPPVPLELLAYSLVGAHHNTSHRSTWDEKYTREDVLGTQLWLFLTVLDALNREEGPDPYISRYWDLIKEIAERQPESPPAIEE
jgi:AcrR family transcriptional regulator